MLQIKLGDYRSVNPGDDPLGRASVGAWPNMSEQEAWDVGRGCWVMKASRAIDEDEVQIVNKEGRVLAVGTIRGLIKHGNRLEIVGEPLFGDPRVGTLVEPTRSQNPISYL